MPEAPEYSNESIFDAMPVKEPENTNTEKLS